MSASPGGRSPRLPPAIRSSLGRLTGVAVVVGFFLWLGDEPLTWRDLQIVSMHMVIVGTAALGMTLVIVSGGIDLSVGSAIALSSVVAALTLERGGSVAVATLAALLTGVVCGVYNGAWIAGLRLPPFIATLGTLGFYRGTAKWISGSRTVNPDHLGGLDGWVSPLPPEGLEWMLLSPSVWLLFLLAIVTVLLLRNTVLGRHAFAIGSNEAAARLCGVRVGRAKVAIYALAGAFTGLAGLLQFARLTQGDPTVAAGRELDVIAAVVIGGASLTGGQGSVLGTLAGAFLMAWLYNRCTVLGWPNYVQEIIVGHVIIFAVALDQWRRSRRPR